MQQPTETAKHIHGFRSDVEGLRAIAVSMVLLYHLGAGWASGGFAGVDVFFVISGFLITGLLMKEVHRTGSISLLEFYARRAKRLFPAAALVLATTSAMTLLVLPRTRWQDIGGDIVASAAYFINWRLAARSVDYLAEDVVPSPAQHFWSLAVEEQYYIVWPVLLFFALFLFRRWFKSRTVLWTTLAAVALPSFGHSIYLTSKDPGTAYFITSTRLWELAIGGSVALAADWCRLIPCITARTIGWAGIAAIVASVFAISTKTPWPGYAAALPTLGTAAVIVAGFAAGPRGPVALLGTRPFCWLGAISYSLYLWHWPLIQIAKAHFQQPELSLQLAAGLLALSVLLAWLTLKLIENPIRFSMRMSENPRYALSTGINFSLAGVIAGLVVLLGLAGFGTGGPAVTRSADMHAGTNPAVLGALALTIGGPDDPALQPVDKASTITPEPERATADVPRAYGDGCQLPYSESTPKPCYYGKPDGRLTVAVVGDSKAVQWIPALEILAQRHNWRLLILAKSACGFHSRPLKQYDGKPYESCTEWNTQVVPLLLGKLKPDVIFTSSGSGNGNVAEDEVSALRERWGLMTRNGVKVIAMANNPNPGGNVYECVAQNKDQLRRCAFQRKPAPATASMKAAAAAVPGVYFVDLNDAICARDVCSAVIGGVLVYRQGSHITATYAESLAPRLEAALQPSGILNATLPTLSASGSGTLADLPRPPPPPAPMLPEGMKLPFPHKIYKDRTGMAKDGMPKRWIQVEFTETSPKAAIDAIDAMLAGKGYVGGQRRGDGGQTKVNYRRRSDGVRVAIVVTPGPPSNRVFLTFAGAPPAN